MKKNNTFVSGLLSDLKLCQQYFEIQCVTFYTTCNLPRWEANPCE